MSNSDIYRKTDLGQEEIRTRRAGLDARSRTLLILANGELAVGALSQRMGLDVLPMVTELARQGLLERVPTRPPRAPAPAAPAATTTPARPAAATRPGADDSVPSTGSSLPSEVPTTIDPAPSEQALAAAKSRIMPLLEPLFGPNALDMARPLLAAPSRQQYLAAVRELSETVAIYRGKKGAAELVRPLLDGL